MGQERKGADSAAHAVHAAPSGQGAKALRSPVPPAKKDDVEDVAWALQTAEATWSRGDHADALKWIRRAAEAASEAENDDRALELAKAAADVASLLSDRPTAVAPPPAAASNASNSAPQSKSSKPPPMQPGSAGSGRPAGAAPTPMKVAGGPPALPRPGQKAPTPPRVQAQVPVSRRGGRRSSPSISDAAAAAGAEAVRHRRASTTNETKKRRSRPAMEEDAQLVAASRAQSGEDPELWPTASLVEDEDVLHTRIGTPAYRESAKKSSTRPPPGPAPPLVMSQAVRVVVWRTADGVHVAPAGTQVAAIGVEAVLLALDPMADLAAWLSNK